MRSVIISKDYITNIGMRLSGIPGIIAKTKKEQLAAFKAAVSDETIGIVIVTEPIFLALQEKIDAHRLKKKIPLIVTIPKRGGLEDKDFLMKYVRDSIGIKID